jgi:hypothetical protein
MIVLILQLNGGLAKANKHFRRSVSKEKAPIAEYSKAKIFQKLKNRLRARLNI